MVLALNSEVKNTDDEMLDVDISKEDVQQNLHEKLVAYVHAISGDQVGRRGVWMEHSYARAGRGSVVRTLLAPPTQSTPSYIDVDTPVPEAEMPPTLLPEDEMEEYSDWPVEEIEQEDESEVESRVRSLAPSERHWTVAASVLSALRSARLAALTAEGLPTPARTAARRGAVVSAARKIRRALAPHWAAPGPPQARPGAWSLSALDAYLPGALQWLFKRVLRALRRRLSPALAARLTPSPTDLPQAIKAEEEDDQDLTSWNESAGRVIWVSTDKSPRWRRALRPLMPILALHASGSGVSGVEAHVARVLAGARARLAHLVDERGVILAGAGAGAALAMALAAGDGGVLIKALVLLSPPLDTPDGPNDALNEISIPMLVISGSRGSLCSVGSSCSLGSRGGRIVVVTGADERLRLSTTIQRRTRVTQYALDHAVAEEIARFVSDITEEPPSNSSDDHHLQVPSQSVEYAHLPTPPTQYIPAVNTHKISGTRTLEIIEGRVVSRGSATPPTPTLAPTDIMHMPIVFADDEQINDKTDLTGKDGALTVTSGHPRGSPNAVKLTRVIVAKRGREGSREGGNRLSGGSRSGGQVQRVGGPRPLVLRRGALTLVPRKREH